jgi:hypothetical protein
MCIMAEMESDPKYPRSLLHHVIFLRCRRVIYIVFEKWSYLPRRSIVSASLSWSDFHMIVHGMIQHWQSSPHQHGSLTGGFFTTPFAIDGEDEVEDVAEVVDGGMPVGTISYGAETVGQVGKLPSRISRINGV